MASKSKRRSRRPRDKDQLRLERAVRQGQRATTAIVTRGAEILSSPKPDADMVGDQPHFLRRVERLPDTARGLAVRLYYSFELRRFVAREALGLKIDGQKAQEPADLAARRVVVDAEPGPTPSRVILDGRGKVITCLAADMAVGSGTRVTHERFQASVERFGKLQELNRSALATAEELDLFRHLYQLSVDGWRASRESVESLLRLGPAAGQLLRIEYEFAIKESFEATLRAVEAGAPTNDRNVRAWFDAVGLAAAMLASLVELGLEPSWAPIHFQLWSFDPVVDMVLAACVARWRPDDGYELFAKRPPQEEAEPNASWQCGELIYLGVLRRARLARGDPPAPDDRRFAQMAKLQEAYEKGIQGARRLGLEPEVVDVFVRDLALLCRGGRPDWGADLADDPETLPPLRIEDLCLPEGVTSPRALRILAQRLLACAERPFTHLFLPAAALEGWEARLGSFHVEREGTFTMPFARQEEAPPVHLNLPGRNEPCPCGSGKKFKRCCLQKLEAGEA